MTDAKKIVLTLMAVGVGTCATLVIRGPGCGSGSWYGPAAEFNWR